MAHRYARIDVDFFHKTTARKLHQELGLAGQLVFIALILRAKDGIEPGVFVYRSEAVGWEKLGFDPEAMPFTLDAFFTVTGRLRQTSRRRVGDVWNVRVTRYGEWQKDSRRYETAVKKARSRGNSTVDTKVTPQGTPGGHKGGPRSRSRSTPIPPLNAKSISPLDCPHCGLRQPSRTALTHHLEHDHGTAATNGHHDHETPVLAGAIDTAPVDYLEELARTEAHDTSDDR